MEGSLAINAFGLETVNDWELLKGISWNMDLSG